MRLVAILNWAQRLLFTAAVSALVYCSFVMIDAWTFQRAGRGRFEIVGQTASPAKPVSLPPDQRDLIGLIEIPRLGMSVVVVEGSSARVLRRAAGHIPGTALPGQPGNAGISGHRDTFFQPLQNIRLNDIITVVTLRGEYRYRVVSTRVVSPYDVAVLKTSRNEVLTLVTCYPFYFVGPAPDRFIVRAERIT